ncbi:4a-hydroxytetrahydrobiopterin dehydratase [Catenuloplanes nepalensis]|uniref:4a-hydroxytetrahydrobiopterin dehydratase n=1 Tax=Catenuloplanes nepalensis TaxID=587533 RepID=A0ABT9MVH8_9ACTN|nr:VOC family protein [Catenuloplanes nepalensis]MDP9795449.1 4a-hydroxytetrahydrobiopterin dehydratase [Catenuloplanes nepalensis]
MGEIAAGLTRQHASDTVHDLGWRYVFGAVSTAVRTRDLAEAATLLTRLATVDGAAAHLRADLRADRVLLTLSTWPARRLTPEALGLAAALTTEIRAAGLTPDAVTDPAVQALEIAIDTLDADAIRPFWRAVLGYEGDTDLHDPRGQGPAVWFQRMDTPRPQRNRLHLDINVPHDVAPSRIAAALAAGGTLLSDAEAPAFRVLTDAEGNEACICSWEARDSQPT